MIKRLILFAATLLLAACTKEVLSPTGKRLGEVTVESEAGELPVLIMAEGTWRAASLADWISVDGAWHRDNYSILLQYSSNQSVEGLHRVPRTGFVIIQTGDGAQTDTLVVNQKGLQL